MDARIAKKRNIIKNMREHGNFSAACRQVGVPARTALHWRMVDPDFQGRVEAVQEIWRRKLAAP